MRNANRVLTFVASCGLATMLLASTAEAQSKAPLSVVFGSEPRSLDPSIDTNGLTLPVTNTCGADARAESGPSLAITLSACAVLAAGRPRPMAESKLGRMSNPRTASR